jgi:integrase
VDELQALMRHTSLQTTMGYYADEDADDTAAAMWGAVSEQKKNKKAQAKAANRRS